MTADTSAENLVWLRAAYPGVQIVGTSKASLYAQFQSKFGDAIADDAVEALFRENPSLSAKTVITPRQVLLIGMTLLTCLVTLMASPLAASYLCTIVMTAGFTASMLFRAVLAWVAGSSNEINHVAARDDETLPSYTILVPLYQEANILPRLVQSLLQLDYPQDRLDIKLIVEADDAETIVAAEMLGNTEPFQIVCVPPGMPRTKPRACNYALAFSRGEYCVVYDAEDRPEPNQLRKAVSQFRSETRDVACVQARLNFYNANENWLTRLFALDYALWFDVLLPGLEKLRIPIPLGGTSNHFRTSALKAAGAWDPYNVTEDADLGIRLAQMGMRVKMLDSTTFEEAPTMFGVWLKQRTRWQKGYMQTWLVHMRNPRVLRSRTGWRGLISLQLFVAGPVLSALVNPLLWLIFLGSCLFGTPVEQTFEMHIFTWISTIGLFSGNAVLTFLAVNAPKRRGWHSLAPYGLTVTFYWALISIAAWRALLQLFTRPFHWEKTAHGVSSLEDASI